MASAVFDSALDEAAAVLADDAAGVAAALGAASSFFAAAFGVAADALAAADFSPGAGVPGLDEAGVASLLEAGVAALAVDEPEAVLLPPILSETVAGLSLLAAPPIFNDIVGGLAGAGAEGSASARENGTDGFGSALRTGGSYTRCSRCAPNCCCCCC